MKVFLALSLMFFTVSAVSGTAEFPQIVLPRASEEWTGLLNRLPIRQALIESLGDGRGLRRSHGGARDPVIPPIDDPLILPDPLDFNLDIDLIRGDGSIRGGIIEGLSTLTDNLQYQLIIFPAKVTLNYTLDLTAFSFHGDYDADFILDLTPFGYVKMDFRGNGEFFANLSGLFVDLSVVIVPRLGTLKVTVQSVSLNPGFQTINLFFENAILNGDPIDYWDDINHGLKAIFDYVWPENQVAIQEAVRGILNDIIVDCTIPQLIGIIDGGDASCLNLPPLPTNPTTTTTRDPNPITTTTGPTTTTTVDPNPTTTTTRDPNPITTTTGPTTTTTVDPNPTTTTTVNPNPTTTTVDPNPTTSTTEGFGGQLGGNYAKSIEIEEVVQLE